MTALRPPRFFLIHVHQLVDDAPLLAVSWCREALEALERFEPTSSTTTTADAPTPSAGVAAVEDEASLANGTIVNMQVGQESGRRWKCFGLRFSIGWSSFAPCVMVGVHDIHQH